MRDWLIIGQWCLAVSEIVSHPWSCNYDSVFYAIPISFFFLYPISSPHWTAYFQCTNWEIYTSVLVHYMENVLTIFDNKKINIFVQTCYCLFVIPALRILNQEDCKFEASLSNMVRPVSKEINLKINIYKHTETFWSFIS